MVFPDLLHGHIFTHLGIHREPDPHTLQRPGKGPDYILGQAIGGDPVHQDAARLFHLIIDRNGMAGLAQIVGGGQTGGACA